MRIIEKGVIVELPLGVEGFVPVSQLSTTPVKNIGEKFKIGDELPLKVVEFDKDSKRIVLSAAEFLKGKDSKVLQDYLSTHKLQPQTLADTATITSQAGGGDTSIPSEN